MYAVYQAQWKFSAATLTAVFAIYAIFLLVTLLLFGSLSDYLGRRPVILAALTITAAACALFLAAHGVGLLFAARALQGVAIGTATGALGAALIDLQPEGRGLAPVATGTSILLGFAVGALASSALVQYGPSLAAQVLRSPSLLWGGLLIFVLAAIEPQPRSRSELSIHPSRCSPAAWPWSPVSR
jgi:MFS family permease